MQNLWFIFEKILYLFFLVLAGILAKKIRLISDRGEKDLSKLLVDLFWPSLIFVSITEKLTSQDILSNIMLPLFGILTCLTGLGVGLLSVKIFKFRDNRKRIFLYDSMINNFIYLVLPFAIFMIPGKGAGFLFIHNLGMILMVWTLGVYILKGGSTVSSGGRSTALKNLLSMGLISTVLAILVVLAGANKYIPSLAFSILNTIGGATLPVAMIIAGVNIYRLGRNALKFDVWNVSLGIVRLVVIPVVLLVFSLFLKNYCNFSRDFLLIFNLVNIMPVSINSVVLSIRFKSSPQLAAEGVVFTHLFCLLTLPVYLVLIQRWIL